MSDVGRDEIRDRVWAAIDARQTGIAVDRPPFDAILARAEGKPPTPPSAPPLSLPTLGAGSAGPGSSGGAQAGTLSAPSAASAATPKAATPKIATPSTTAPNLPTTAGKSAAGRASRAGSRGLGRAARIGLAVTIVAAATVVGVLFRHEVRCVFAAESADEAQCDPSTEATLRSSAETLIGSLEQPDPPFDSKHIPERCSESDIRAGHDAMRDTAVSILETRVIGSVGSVKVSFGAGETASVPWVYWDGRWVVGLCDALDFGG